MKRILFLCLCLTAGLFSETRQISAVHLINRLTDLEALAKLPEPGESSAMWSSYERKSQYDEAAGRYLNWDANSDGLHQYIRREGENIVMAEMEGPGAIVRIWSAMPETGHVKIYIDDQPEPIVDLPFIRYFDNSVAPFDYPELCYMAARGQNNYVPIAYQKSCKVVAEPGWGNYFHFNFCTFPEGTQVEPFSMFPDRETLEALDRVNRFFAEQMGELPDPILKESLTIQKSITIPAGETVILAHLKGENAIRRFVVTPDSMDRLSEEIVLRKLILEMFWDDNPQPAVWSPLGDFFGTAPGWNPYKTLPMGMTQDGFYSNWVMPFATGARIQLTNTHDQDQKIDYVIVTGKPKEPVEELGRFHAKWHEDVFPLEDSNRWPDWTLLRTQGRGRYVGTMLHVLSPARAPCVEAAGLGHAWWGEGDEKFFVDGEKFPSTFGTGTEDYFGYAWGTPDFFEKAFHSQSKTMNNEGHQTLSRLHIIDNVPFQKSFDGYLEKYYPNDCGTFYDCVVYWYVSADGIDAHEPVPVSVDLWAPSPKLNPDQAKILKGESIQVLLQSDYPDVFYTLDGSDPSLDSPRYETPVAIRKTTTLKARVFAPGGRMSGIVSGKYSQVSLRPAITDPGILGPGLRYGYYEGAWERLPDFGSLTPVATGLVETLDLSRVQREDDYGLTWSGFIRVPKDGMYTFYLHSDDGSRLIIDGDTVVDNDMCHAPQTRTGQIALREGLFTITILYFEAKLDNVFEVAFEGPGFRKQAIPRSALFHQE